MRKSQLMLSALFVSAISMPSNAALLDRGGGMLYDTVLNLTWLQDANYAKTSGYSTTGRMSWQDAMQWADSLQVGGFNDWRLATITDTGSPGCDFAYGGTDCGHNTQPSTSELSYMFYVNLGLKSIYDSQGNFQADFGIANGNLVDQVDVGLVKNLRAYNYWAGSPYAPDLTRAWQFNTTFGIQGRNPKTELQHAWAVRDGDVATIPLPGAVCLFGSGLVGLMLRSRQGRGSKQVCVTVGGSQ